MPERLPSREYRVESVVVDINKELRKIGKDSRNVINVAVLPKAYGGHRYEVFYREMVVH
jgi:hypothetical protein